MKRRQAFKFMAAGAVVGVTGVPLGIRAFTGTAEAAGLAFPRLANVYYGPISGSQVPALGQYDLLILSGESFARSQYGAIKQANPSVKILPYMDSVTGNFADAGGPLNTAGFSNNWYLTTSSGSNIVFGNNMTNCSDVCPTNSSGQRWTDFLAQWVHDTYWANGVGDGIFFDNCWNYVDWLGSNEDLYHNGTNSLQANGSNWVNTQWEAGMQNLMQKTRALLGPNAIVMGNGPLYDNSSANGELSEGFNYWEGSYPSGGIPAGDFNANFTRYLGWTTNHYGNEYYILLQDLNQGSGLQTNYAEMRYWLGVTLLGEGYFTFSGPQSGGYVNIWWYDEYSVDLTSGRATGDASRKGYLGNPSASASQLSNGVWRRDFDNGIVLVNTTGSTQGVSLETTYRRISGTQDPSVNNGALVSSVSLQNQNAIILLRTTAPPTPTATATFVPPTATSTRVPPTNTPTATPKPPTATSTATAKPAASTPTATPKPPAATSTATPKPPAATSTPKPPAATSTPKPPAATPTATHNAATATPTATATKDPPAATPTATATTDPPSATPTATATPNGDQWRRRHRWEEELLARLKQLIK